MSVELLTQHPCTNEENQVMASETLPQQPISLDEPLAMPTEHLGQPTGTIDLLEDSMVVTSAPSLELLKIGNNQTPFILFAKQAVARDIHYWDVPEIKGYILCNGEGCLSCLAGRKKDRRLLTPVYSPTSMRVMILPFSESTSPGSLFPQIKTILKANRRVVVFGVRLEYSRYQLSTFDIQADADAGEKAIKEFLATQRGEGLLLPPMYPQLTNDQLLDIPSVANVLRLRRIIK